MFAISNFVPPRIGIHTTFKYKYTRTFYPPPATRMDASTAAEECEDSLSLLSSQGSSPQDAASTSTTKDDKGEQENAKFSACIPDPTVIMKLGPEQQSASNEPPESGSGRAWGSDKCVMMKCYRPGSNEVSRYQVVVSGEPVLISELRFVEQHVAYDTLLAEAPAGEIQEHYRLHLARLKGIRKDIAASGVAVNKLQGYKCGYYLYLHNALDNAKSQSEVQRLKEGSLAYEKAVKKRDKLRACERAVARLLVRCEDAGKGEPGFEKVSWQTG